MMLCCVANYFCFRVVSVIVPTPMYHIVQYCPLSYDVLYLALYVWPQFSNPNLGANNSGPTSIGAKPYFVVSWTILMVELVHKTIKYGLAPWP
jgi:hypothetical protein